MTTQYTTILKLALPVQGELSGTWGDVVNDNITEMVEQAIAGKATINSWTGNSHTLTTADGTTSESRCAILELTDSGTALTGAGTVVCPTNTKLYIVDNNTAEIITVQTAAGTGVAVPVGKTMLVYCDGTNVVEGVTHANSLSLGTSTVTADKILDEDNMASDSATAIATQQSIKAYVDSQVGTVDTLSEILANGNTTGANDIDVDSAQKVQFRDADIYLNSSVDGQLDIVADGEVQIDTALVDINGNLDVSGTTNISGSVSFTKNAIAGVAISTTSRSSNTVTVTTSAVHGLTNGDLVNINGVANRSFNGYFTVSVSSTTVFTYSQTGADESSTGGTSTEIVYNLNASGTALNQMNGPLNIAANSAIDGLEITQSGSGEALSITGGNALFGDNDKAIFGIGNDLQIYHDGSNSYIDDAGTGDLLIRAENNLFLKRTNSDETYFSGAVNGAVTLFHNNNAKLATTISGVDITGTVTADGLTVVAADAALAASIGSNEQRVYITPNGTEISYNASGDAAGSHMFQTGNIDRLNIASNGDLSLYEDTGTTPKFFWDSSAESLGIGTSSPAAPLDVVSSSGAVGAYIRGRSSDNIGSVYFTSNASASTEYGFIQGRSTDLRIQGFNNGLILQPSGGNVGIGTSSPSSIANYVVLETQGDTTTTGGIYYSSSSDSSQKAHFYIGGGTGYLGTQTNHPLAFTTNNTTRMTLDASGRVGIGVTPSTLWSSSYDALQIGLGGSVYAHDSAGSNMQMAANSVYEGTAPNYYDKYLTSSTASKYVQDSGLHIWSTAASGTAGNAITWSEAMRIRSDGFVGIGNGGLAATRLSVTNSVVGVNIETTSATAGHEGLIVNRQNSDGIAIAINKAGATVGSIGAANGNLYLGQGDTTIMFSASSDAVLPKGTDGADRDGFINLGQNVNRFKNLHLSGGMQLSRAVTSETEIESYNNTDSGGAKYKISFKQNGTQVGVIEVGTSSTNYITSSDYRLKENVAPLTSATERLKQLNPSRFNFIADADTTVDGFLAHEVQDIVPEAISGTKDAMRDEEYEVTPAVLDDDGNVITEAVMGTRSVPDYQGIDQSKLVPLLVATIQELEARIAALES